MLDLKGNLTIVRTFDKKHLTDDYIGWLNDPEVVRYSNQRFFKHSFKSCECYFDTFKGSPNLFLAIHDLKSEKHIGTMTVYRSLPHGTADVGILLGDKAFWGKGYGVDAWKTVLSYLFQELKLRKVTAGTVSSNVGMMKIAQKNGMQLEAIRSRQLIYDGLEEDVALYGIFNAND
jgi:ribosomal-protein-alanine N-acetyltransferase